MSKKKQEEEEEKEKQKENTKSPKTRGERIIRKSNSNSMVAVKNQSPLPVVLWALRQYLSTNMNDEIPSEPQRDALVG